MKVKPRVHCWRCYKRSILNLGDVKVQPTGGGREAEVLKGRYPKVRDADTLILYSGQYRHVVSFWWDKTRVHILYNVIKITKSDITILSYR